MILGSVDSFYDEVTLSNAPPNEFSHLLLELEFAPMPHWNLEHAQQIPIENTKGWVAKTKGTKIRVYQLHKIAQPGPALPSVLSTCQ